ncbi:MULTISPECIES: hypothetical protein [Sphingomonas]|uniref:hypothetical protein n=1 Tax=Sphingomonas TaxID=13687 RepID=UPI000DEFD90C|nr:MULTISPECIES: hypothetical protein [Sphingomonas]
MRSLGLLLLIAGLGACSTPGDEPSLAPRAAELIDPRVPIPDTSGSLPASGSLSTQLRSLVARARSAQGAADRAIAAAEASASRAGPRQSESWIAAQQLLSAAITARSPVTTALGDIDALTSRSVNQLVPTDLKNVAAAAAEVTAIDTRQAERIEAMQRRLGS